MIQFLEQNNFLNERLSAGIDVHPSDSDLKEFQNLAKEIEPDRYFTIYGCQSCVNDLVKFVYDHQKTFIKKETFPNVTKKEDAAEESDTQGQ